MKVTPISQTYAEARTVFLDAAHRAEARVDSFPHPLEGKDGESLFVDVAEVGSATASNVIVIVSGTHGVEGYLGSALQRRHLASLDAAPQSPSAPTLVFIHALNPYGFSWVRRVNEDNVDLNRNFIDWSQPPPSNDGYGRLADTLVPTSWTREAQEQTGSALIEQLGVLGLDKAQQVISGGQYDHPTGLFYGGTGPTWSHRFLKTFIGRRLAEVDRAAVIDLHTGLGPWGHAELISSATSGSSELARQRSWWKAVTCLGENDSVSADIVGEWMSVVTGYSPDTEITGIAIEYGTVDTLTVLDSLRADAVLHGHGDPTSPDADSIRRQVRAAFIDDDPAWFETCLPAYEATVAAAVSQLA